MEPRESPPRVPTSATAARAARGRRAAFALALAADAIQFGLLPLFGEGVLAPLNDALDLVVGILLVRMLGWHPAFLPAFVAELVPGLDLFPTWTAAVWFVTRMRSSRARKEEAPPPA